jgi:DNA-binding NarL/FixJ family response regulator
MAGASEVPPAGRTPEVPPASRTRVLIADDDRLFAEMLRSALASQDGFEVVALAANGAEAVAGTKSLKPTLVLMDVGMPLLDGIEATRQMRELADPPTIVLITGDPSECGDKRAYEAGAAAYLRKTPKLMSVIDVVVALSRVATGVLSTKFV